MIIKAHQLLFTDFANVYNNPTELVFTDIHMLHSHPQPTLMISSL